VRTKETMSAKKITKPAIPDSIPLTEEQKKFPEVKALLKKLKEDQEKADIEKKLTPICDFAGKTLSQTFKSWGQMVKFVEKMTKGSVGGGRLTKEQKDKITELLKTDKGNSEIAKEVKCKATQVSSLRNRLKSGK
jgi:hypothetical protein